MKRSIGVFDSGVGGLTVLSALRELMPNENYIYLGDTKNVPYGTKSPSTISLLSKNVYKKLENYDIKLLVIGCNTATIHGLDAIREISKVPVIGIVEAGIEATIESNASNIVLLATEATVNSGFYQNNLKMLNNDITIQSVGCPDMVTVVESGVAKGTEGYEVVSRCLEKTSKKEDALILGCTHFPVLKDNIKAYYKNLNINISLINPADKCAEITEKLLKEESLLSDSKIKGETLFITTGDPKVFIKGANSILDTPLDINEVVTID